jgi:hypothetical protein
LSGPPVIPSQNIHPLGRGEFAGAACAVALGIIAPGAGHRRREGFLQPRLGRFHGSRRRLVTEVCADRLRRGQSRERIALRPGNGRFEFGDLAAARSGSCIGGGESEHRADKSRRHPGTGHREHPAAGGADHSCKSACPRAGIRLVSRRRMPGATSPLRKQGPITTGFHCQEGNWPRAQSDYTGYGSLLSQGRRLLSRPLTPPSSCALPAHQPSGFLPHR